MYHQREKNMPCILFHYNHHNLKHFLHIQNDYSRVTPCSSCIRRNYIFYDKITCSVKHVCTWMLHTAPGHRPKTPNLSFNLCFALFCGKSMECVYVVQ